ncbi:MAG: methyltransferase [Pseudomonadota bacterium]
MHLIARAAHIAPAVVIDGQKIDGVDSILKALRPRGGVSASLSKAKGKVFVVQGAALEDWVGAGETAIEGGFFTRPGIFSADGVDPGSRLLAQALPQNLPATVADLGAGWGFLARAVLARDGVETLHLVESDHWALDCARRNVQDPRAQFHWADALDWSPGQPLDTIVMNPPFHQGRTADPALGQAFIRAAARLLNRHGTLWLVANRHLPYEKTLEETFREVRPVGHDPAFKLYQAQHPRAL